MKKRNLQILSEIIRHPNLKSGDLEKQFKITRRQLAYALAQINQELVDHQLPKITRTPRGEFVTPSEVADFFNVQATEAPQPYVYREEDERILLICLYLLVSDELLSLVHIYDFSGVSRTTTSADLKAVARFLEERQLTLKYTRQAGYFIAGSEQVMRNLLNYLVTQLLTYDDGRSSVEQLGKVPTEQVIHFIHKIENVRNVTYSDESFSFLMLAVLMNVTRNLSHRAKDTPYFEHQISDTQEFAQLKPLIPQSWLTSDSDAEWLVILLLSANTIRGDVGVADQALVAAIRTMVAKFEQQTFIKVADQDDFVKRLLAHLRPAIFRVRYGLHLRDIGIGQVMAADPRHRFLVDTIDAIIEPLEKLTGKTIPEDERNLIAFYFDGELEKSADLHVSKERAAVVCTNGLIVSKLMIQNLRRLFPEISFLSATSAREFEHFSGDYDLVFTTVPLKTSARQYIIHPLLSEDEQVQLRYRVLNDIGVKNIQTGISALTEIVRKHAKITDSAGLDHALRRFLADQGVEELPEVHQPRLSALTVPNLIQIGQSRDWQNALQQAIEPLERLDYVTDPFRQTLIDETAAADNYSFIGTEVAIPHTVPENGVLNNGFAFYILKQPVIYPNGFHIRMIVPIAIKDTDQHLQAIQELSEIIADATTLKQLLNAKSGQQAYEILQHYESKSGANLK